MSSRPNMKIQETFLCYSKGQLYLYLIYPKKIMLANDFIVEIQAQHLLDRCGNREAVEQIFRDGIYLGVSVGAQL